MPWIASRRVLEMSGVVSSTSGGALFIVASTSHALPHDDLLALVPVPEERKVRVNGIDGVLPCDGKEDADRRDDRFREPILNRGFHPYRRESAFLSGIDGMAVGSPGQPM